MAKRKIIWAKQAIRQFNAAIEYIRKNSEQNADTVKQDLLTKIGELADDRVLHRKDQLRKNNDGHFLYFEILKYRIVYYDKPDKVFIVRIRHTKREPREY